MPRSPSPATHLPQEENPPPPTQVVDPYSTNWEFHLRPKDLIKWLIDFVYRFGLTLPNLLPLTQLQSKSTKNLKAL